MATASFTGTANADSISGSSSDDTIIGYAGNDTLSGLGGDDVIIGGSGNDSLNGGADDDILAYYDEGGGGAVSVNTGTGRATDTFGDTDSLANFESIYGTELDDLFILNSTDDIVVWAADGNDTIRALKGNVTLNYYRDYTQSDGRNGVTVDFGAGSVIDGFGDTDTLVGEAYGVYGSIYADKMTAADWSVSFTGSYGDDTLTGGGQADTLNGGNDDDMLVGLGGADMIVGESGDDTIKGGAGSDVVGGGDGNDLVKGQAGGDSVTGGNGADTLYGNAGNDTMAAGLATTRSLLAWATIP